MEKLLQLMSETALFKGFSREEVSRALLCLEGAVRSYARREVIDHGEAPMRSIGLVLSGSVHVCKDDGAGGQALLFGVSRGELIGDVSLRDDSSDLEGEAPDSLAFHIVAAENCDILFVKTSLIIRSEYRIGACALRSRIVENLLSLVVRSNARLYRKLALVAHRSLRTRILRYLESLAGEQRSRSIAIPYSRAELADYLMVDRSALSRELSRMQADGLISFSRNQFELL